MDKAIIVTLETDGAVSVEAEGYSGASCLKATETLLKQLGGTVAATEAKPEMWAAEQMEVIKHEHS